MNPTFGSTLPRVALIGISGYGNIHLQLALHDRDRGQLIIVAATVINPDEVPAEVAELQAHGTEIFADYEAMLAAHAGRIDLCLVPTGIHWHARMTIAALQVGANVLVEKPLSGVMNEVEAVQRAERASGCFVAVGFQDYYESGTAWLKQHLVNGAIGRIETVRFCGMWPRPREYFKRNTWAGRLRLGEAAVFDSPLSNAFAHFAMLGLYFAGQSLPAVAEATLLDGELWRAQDIETFDTAVVRLRTADAIDLWFGVTHSCVTSMEPEIVITGSKGRAGWRYEKEAWWSGGDGLVHRCSLPDAHGARRAMMDTVLRRLVDSTTGICTTEMAAQHTRLIEALHAQLPVQEFAAEHVKWRGEGSHGIPEVVGLEEALRAAYCHGSLFENVEFNTIAPVAGL
jgi:predicted dehydrogenase